MQVGLVLQQSPEQAKDEGQLGLPVTRDNKLIGGTLAVPHMSERQECIPFCE